MQYERNDFQLTRGKFRVRGDTVELCPAYTEDAVRIEFFGDEIDRITRFDPISGEIDRAAREHHHLRRAALRHARRQDATRACGTIREELDERIARAGKQGKLLEAQRLKMRTTFDLEMMEEMGFCNGIENYSRHTSGRPPGSRPYTLIDFFPSDFLTIIDESHVAVPQIGGMYEGDRSRKTVLVEHGFRLPSALDNRPLKFDEFDALVRPAALRLRHAREVRSGEIGRRHGGAGHPPHRPARSGDRDQAAHGAGRRPARAGAAARRKGRARARHHADQAHGGGPGRLPARSRREGRATSTPKSTRSSAWKSCAACALGEVDVLIGINLLREGLDLPEVSLVAVLDADKEGFLRSQTSLIQTAGRAARHLNGLVILYADTITDSIKELLAVSKDAARKAARLQQGARHHAALRRARGAGKPGQRAQGPADRRQRGRRGGADMDVMQVLQELESRNARRLRLPCTTKKPRCCATRSWN